MNSYAASVPEGLPARGRPDSVLRLAQLTKLLRRNLWLVTLCALLTGAGAFVYAHTLPKTYTANGLLAVAGDQFALPALQGVLRGDDGADPMPIVHTEVQALTSRALDAQVVSELRLRDVPEFNADLRPPTLMKKIKQVIGDAVASFMPKAPPGIAVPPSDDGVIAAAQKALSVFQDNKSLVISVSFVSRDPQLASRFVNTLIRDYVTSRAQRRVDADQGANAVITQRVAQARADLSSIEAQMQALRNRGDVVGVRAGSIGQQQVEELTTAAASASLERSQLEVNYQRATAAVQAGSSDALATVLNSPTISRLRDEEAQAASNVAQLSAHYGANHPQMRIARAEEMSARRQLREEAERIIASLGSQLKVATDQEAYVRQQLEQARYRAVQAENARARLDQLQQEETTRRALYQSLLQSSQQTLAQPAANATPDVRVLSPAAPPAFPSGPHVVLVGLLGGCAGALLGCLLALSRLRTVRGFEVAEDVTLVTGMTVLATLPRRLIRRDQGLLGRQVLAGGQRARAAERPGSWSRVTPAGGGEADMEAMRVLRHRLRFAGRSGVPHCALFMPGAPDGTAPLAAPLAAAFARAAALDGERVLLIEADLQAPSLAHQLGLNNSDAGSALRRGGATACEPPSGGMPAVLSGADWRDQVVADQHAGLDLLLAGGRLANAHALLGGVLFQNLLVETRAEYDLVVLHGPAASTSDAASLVQRTDAAIMVIDGRVDQAVAREAAARLRAVARTPLVAVLVQRS